MAEQGHRPKGCVRLRPLGCPVALGPMDHREGKSREVRGSDEDKAQRVCAWLTEANVDFGGQK